VDSGLGGRSLSVCPAVSFPPPSAWAAKMDFALPDTIQCMVFSMMMYE
jgi:hypothetical protein